MFSCCHLYSYLSKYESQFSKFHKNNLQHDANVALYNKKFYLIIPGQDREKSTAYARDDLWILSPFETFYPCASSDNPLRGILFARSVYFGPTKDGQLEILPYLSDANVVSSLFRSLPPGQTTCVRAIRGPNVSTLCQMIGNMELLCRPDSMAKVPLRNHFLGQFTVHRRMAMTLNGRFRGIIKISSIRDSLLQPPCLILNLQMVFNFGFLHLTE